MWKYLKTHLFVRIALLFLVTLTGFGVLMGLYIRSNNQKRRQAGRIHLETRGRDLARSLG